MGISTNKKHPQYLGQHLTDVNHATQLGPFKSAPISQHFTQGDTTALTATLIAALADHITTQLHVRHG
jgi:hypothetical protein